MRKKLTLKKQTLKDLSTSRKEGAGVRRGGSRIYSEHCQQAGGTSRGCES